MIEAEGSTNDFPGSSELNRQGLRRPLFLESDTDITLHHFILFGFYGEKAKQYNAYNHHPEYSLRKFCKGEGLAHRVMVKTLNRLEAMGGKLLLEREFKNPTGLIPQPLTPDEAKAIGPTKRRGILLPFGVLWSEFALLFNTLYQIVSQAKDARETLRFVRDMHARAAAQLNGAPPPEAIIEREDL